MATTDNQKWAKASKLPASERDPYFALPAISSSFCGTYLRAKAGLPEPNFRHAVRIGHALHELVLEPHKFKPMNFTGKERIHFMGMARAIREQATVPIDATQRKEVCYQFERSGLKAKAKVDIVDDARKFIADIKTTYARSYDEFEALVIERSYQRQAAFYLDIPEIAAAGIDVCHFVAVTKSKPFRVFEYQIRRASKLYDSGHKLAEFVIGEVKADHELQFLKSVKSKS